MFFYNIKEDMENILPLTELQKEMFAAVTLGKCDYMEQIKVYFHQNIDIEILKQALEKMVQTQEALRVVFRMAGTKTPVQILLRKIILPLYIDELPTQLDIGCEPWNLVWREADRSLELQYCHIVMDGWGMSIFWQQLIEGYGEICEKQDWYPQLAYGLESYHKLILDRINITDYKMNSDYFFEVKTKLSECLFPLAEKNIHGKNEVLLSEKLKVRLHKMASQLHVTPAVLFYSSWLVLLGALTGKDKVCCGIVLSGRNNMINLCNTIGMFIQKIPLCVQLDLNIEELCSTIRKYLSDEYVNMIEAEKIVNDFTKKNEKEIEYDSLIVFENYPLEIGALEHEDIQIDKYEYYERPSNSFTLQIQVVEEVKVKLTTDIDKYSTHLPYILEAYVYLLEQISEGCLETRCLKLCREVMGDNLICKSPHTTLPEIIRKTCIEKNANIAIVEGAKRVTFEELLNNSLQGASNLQQIGVLKGDAIGINMQRSTAQLIAIYSVILAGGVYVPFTGIPFARANNMIKQAKVSLIISDEKMSEFGCKCISADVLWHKAPPYSKVSVQSTDTAYILFTSGSTGNPKGCVITHNAIMNRLNWNRRQLKLKETTRQLYKTPITFDVSLIEIFSVFFAANTLYILPEGEERFPERILNCIKENHINYVHFVPSMLKMIDEYIQEHEAYSNFSDIRLLVCSGEILPRDLVLKIHGYRGCDKMEIVNLYGPTEAAVDVSFYYCGKNIPTTQTPIGKAIDNTIISIMDSKKRCLPVGVGGELYIMGTNVGEGYVSQTELTEEKFIELRGEKAYRTGDYAYRLSDNNVVVVGRIDEQIKYNGVRIETAEIEQILFESDLVKDAVVILLQRLNRLIVFYRAEVPLDNRLREYLRLYLPVSMLPNDYVWMERFPISKHGKVDKKQLLEGYNNRDNKIDMVVDLNKTEKKLNDVWCEILECEKQFRPEDNFFSSGGNSISLVRMLIAIRKKWNVNLASGKVYGCPTLKNIAQEIEQANRDEGVSIKLNILNNKEKSSIAFFQVNHPNNTAYNMPVMLELKPDCNLERVEKALLRVLNKYDWLYKRYKFEGENLKEIIVKEQLKFITCYRCDTVDLKKKCNEFVRPFDINERLFRIEIVISENKNYILIDFHHLLCDQSVIKFLLSSWIYAMEGNVLPKLYHCKTKENEYKISNTKRHISEGTVLDDITPILSTKSGDLGRYNFKISEKEAEKLKLLCSMYNHSIFQVLFASFFVLCRKISGKQELTIGTNTTGDELESQEMQLHTLPITVSLENEKKFEQVLQNIAQELSVSMNRDGEERSERFDVMFVREEPIFLDDRIKQFVVHFEKLNRHTKFGIVLFYQEKNGKIYFTFDFDKGLFEESAIAGFAESYLMIMGSIVNNPICPIKDINTIGRDTEKKLIRYSAGVKVPFYEKTLQETFAMICNSQPDSIVIYEGDSCVTRRELYAYSTKIAFKLSELAEPDSIIGILMPASANYLIAMMGILVAGCTFLPMDVTQPSRRNEQILQESKAIAYITDGVKLVSDTLCYTMDSFEDLECIETVRVRPSNNAYCIFTSGSTGKPKGCVISQKNIINYISWANAFYCGTDSHCFAFFTSPAVDMTITSTLIPMLYNHTVVIYPQNADSVAKIFCDRRITILKVTPSHLDMMVGSRGYTSTTIKCLIVGGEQLKASTVNKIKNKLNQDTNIYNEYGPTESTVACMVYKYSEKCKYTVIPIGRAIQNMAATIRDKEGKLSLLGTKGQLVVEGIGITGGYLRNPELTRKYFKHLDGNSWCYETGDMARMLSNGDVICEGRNDDQYKMRGYRVELAEISAATQSIECVKQALALMENNHLLLFYTARENNISEIELRRRLFDLIPHYMMPAQIVLLPYFPLAKSGKIDKNQLLMMKEKKETLSHNNSIYDYVRKSWADELGTTDFSDEDGFLEIGGNSISIVSLHSKLAKRFSKVTVADLFRYPSIRVMSEFLAEQTDTYEVIGKTAIESREAEVAIIGVGFELPDANNLASLHDVFLRGRSSVGYLSERRAHDEKVRLKNQGILEGSYRFSMASTLSQIDNFDYNYFHIGKDEATAMDPAHKLLFTVVDNALANAGISREQIKGRNCAVIIAMPTNIGFTKYLRECFPSLAKLAPLNDVESSIVGRLAFFYDLHGPAYLMDCACSSGLAAIHEANELLMTGECDMAIVGGVNLIEAIDFVDTEHAKVLSPCYHAKAFSSNADGTARGEGCICYVLERLEKAKEEKRSIYAIIQGSAMNNDGFSASLTAPNGRMQEQVIRKAWEKSKVLPEELCVFETHGTATPLGDAIELQAINNVMRGTKPGHCAISASKTVYGHLDSVSGLLSILKCILSMVYYEVYPVVGMKKPIVSEGMLSSAFYFPNQVFSLNKYQKIICGINSFGLSGTNVHVVLENSCIYNPQKSHMSRLNPKYCWLPETPEVEKEPETAKHNTLRIQKADAKQIAKRLLEKVGELYSNVEVSLEKPLYHLGFDSISVIQLKIFILNTFGTEIEVSSQDNLQSIAKEIVEMENYKMENDHSADALTIKREEIDSNDSWFNFQLRYKLQEFQSIYESKTSHSKAKLMNEKLFWANGRFMTGHTDGLEAFSYPILIKQGKGAEVWDIDGNRYVDFSMGFGANLFGHCNDYIMEKVSRCLDDGIVLGPLMESPFLVAERICTITGLERISFCNSGTEAMMNLVRIARASTGKENIVVFEGAFHGTFDPLYVQKKEWGNSEKPVPRSTGTPLHYLSDVIMLKYGDDTALEYIENHRLELAAVIVEPIQSRHPALRPKKFIKKLRGLTHSVNIPLIFDEVISGFRCSLGGAQEYYGIQADLVAYGKVIGGGFPIGMFGGKAIYMDMVDHRGSFTENGNVKQWVSTGGTFNGHPASMAAAWAVLDLLSKEEGCIYNQINEMTSVIANRLNEFFLKYDNNFQVEFFGSQFIITGNNGQKLRLLQYLLISKGIFVWEGGTCFISTAHTWEQIHLFINTVKLCIYEMEKLIPEKDGYKIWVDNRIQPKNYEHIKKLISKYSDIEEIALLESNMVSVVAYNIANHYRRLDYAMLHIRLESKINEEKISDCINKVVNSHRHLRSGVCWRRVDRPVKIIYKNVRTTVKMHYCTKLEKDIFITEVIQQRKREGFIIEKAPLVIFDILIDEGSCDIIMSYYNSWFDGWSADELLLEIEVGLLHDGHTEVGMDWNEYTLWNKEHSNEAESYWKTKNFCDNTVFCVPPQMNQYIEVRESFSRELQNRIKQYCIENKISQASLYLYCMSRTLGIDCMMTSVSGRGGMIKGILHEIGLFSGLVPVKTDSIKEINYNLNLLNQLPVCSNEKIAEYTGVNINHLSAMEKGCTLVILNQRNKKKNRCSYVVNDESYVHVPRRFYILPCEELLITCNMAVMSEKQAKSMACDFMSTMSKILEQEI